MIKKLIQKSKKSLKYIVAFIIGCVLTGTVYAATSIAGANVTYSNTNSGLTSTNVTGAINELYEKAENQVNSHIKAAYNYNGARVGGCKTGNEATCTPAECINIKTQYACGPGTIIDYEVKPGTVERFHVINDTGKVLVMQHQKDTTAKSKWTEKAIDPNSSYDTSIKTEGPTAILQILESATSSWTNVNSKTYTAGTTVLYGNRYTGCSTASSCTLNSYTMSSRTAKARLITVQELSSLACTESFCSGWLQQNINENYWTMSTEEDLKTNVWTVSSQGKLKAEWIYGQQAYPARAVVEINK